MENKTVYVCIHGHFYQPPRENPWTEEIDFQPSAFPFHDWNERIHFECYQPNAASRVFNEKGKIADIVNNYEWISFNFGPTLLSWMAQKHPEIYDCVLEADRKSLVRHKGHGNALAQGYNHMILPLANRRDKETQIRWGIEDFRYRFGREPEGLWLPEAACNQETLEVLNAYGIKFIILDPRQADAIRPFNRKSWEYLSDFKKIDPRRVYRCFLAKDSRRFVDIFFYDGLTALNVAFGEASYDAKRFGGQLKDLAEVPLEGNPLVHIATDGETYGHHKPFANNFLAYLVTHELSERKFLDVNYGEFLAENPPQYAVMLKEGPNGEGTSWSCAHGVGRWKTDCGCSTGGPEGWTQQWRGPLREALDWLRDEAAQVCQKVGNRYLEDFWLSRDDYIHVVLDRSDETVEAFLKKHARKILTKEERILCVKVLEAQRYAMLMYTSCGWFFSELSGIETVQVLQYAARVMELVTEVGGANLEKEFLKRLSKAKSNLPEFGNGRGVYEKLVRPALVSWEKRAAVFGIAFMLGIPDEELSRGNFDFECFYDRRECRDGLSCHLQRIRLLCKTTQEEREFIILALNSAGQEPTCLVKPFQGLRELQMLEQKIFDEGFVRDTGGFVEKVSRFFKGEYYFLKQFLVNDRIDIFSKLAGRGLTDLCGVYEGLFDSEEMKARSGGLSGDIACVAELLLQKKLRREILKWVSSGFDERKKDEVVGLIHLAERSKLDPGKNGIARLLSEELGCAAERLLKNPEDVTAQACLNIQAFAAQIGVGLDLTCAQNSVFSLLKGEVFASRYAGIMTPGFVNKILKISDSLGVDAEDFRGFFGKKSAENDGNSTAKTTAVS